MRVLLTGAAGFIGSAVASELRASGHDVVGVDAYIPQAHQPDAGVASDPAITRADVTDYGAVAALLDGVDAVCHQAAMVGAGVTAADLPLFAANNDLGTAVVLAAMSEAGVGTLVLASSMVVYGDGRYSCLDHGSQTPAARTLSDLKAGRFEMACPICSADLGWELVDESARLAPRSGYAASKVAQEHYASSWARQARASVVALRYHNVYGPGMPRDTPYSGVAALFRSALERGEAPRVFEDGGQMRDFVHVSDVARANALALERATSAEEDTFAAYNVGSGQPISISGVASALAVAVGGAPPVTTAEFRPGDVRHIVASSDLASAELGYVARVQPQDGLAEFASAPLR